MEVELRTICAWARLVLVIIKRVAGNGPPGHTILFTHPLAEIHELTTFGAKGSKRIILPLDRFVAGGAFFHEPIRGARGSID